MVKISEKAKTQVLYDIKIESERIRAALEKLSQQKPGAIDKGGKKDVATAVKKEIVELIKRGYTTQQIADAMRTDSFNIFPKMITEVVNKPKLRKSTKKSKEPVPHVEPTNSQMDEAEAEPTRHIGNNNNGATEETPHYNKEQNSAGVDEKSQDDGKIIPLLTESTLPNFAVGKIPWNKIIYARRRIFIDNQEKTLTLKEFEELKPHAGEIKKQ